MTENKLQRVFQKTADGPQGACKFPEPGRQLDIPVEQPSAMRVVSSKGERIDSGDNSAERRAFKQRLKESVAAGDISEAEARKWYSLVN